MCTVTYIYSGNNECEVTRTENEYTMGLKNLSLGKCHMKYELYGEQRS